MAGNKLHEMAKLREGLTTAFPGERLVFGDGNADASLILVGEAPGEQEALQGRPFVGKAGKNLDAFLDLAGVNRSDIYITNAVKYRPTRISPAGRTVNRPPKSAEVERYRPWLLREIDIISPQCVATLGNVPLKALLGIKTVIGEVHGRFIPINGVMLYPMYHPASLIYNSALRDVYARDIVRLGQWLRSMNLT